MRRSQQWPGLALVLGLGLSGGGTFAAEDPPTVVFTGTTETIPLAATIDLRELAARDEAVSQGVPSPTSAHAPMPIPDMPPVQGAPSGPDVTELVGPSFLDLPVPEAPPLGDGFLALPDFNGSIPPDTHGAAGPAHLMVTLNTSVRVQNKITHAALLTAALSTFWSGANGGSGSFDPRVTYDPYGGRWLIAACDDQVDGGVLVGVSRSSDPTGVWDQFRIPAGAGFWADYPTLGFNGKWVVVQVNIFTNTTNNFVESRVYAIDRSAFYGGPPAVLSVATIPLVGVSGTQVPAVTYDNLLPDLYLLQSYSSVGGQLALYKLTGRRLLANGPADRQPDRPPLDPQRGRRGLRAPAPDPRGARLPVLLPRALHAPGAQDPGERLPHAERRVPQRPHLGRADRPAPGGDTDPLLHPVVAGEPHRRRRAAGPRGRPVRHAVLRLPEPRRQQERRRAARLLALPGRPVRRGQLLVPHRQRPGRTRCRRRDR